MAPVSKELEDLINRLYDVNGIKFGNFVVRTGETTPFYIDMRVIWAYPDIVRSVCREIYALLEKSSLKYDLACGLPYQGIPLSSCLCVNHNIPMLLKRKSAKSYGTCNEIEGHFTAGQKIVLLDDVLMTGGTLVEDIPFFRSQDLDVTGVIVFIDRDQGGIERTKYHTGVDVHCVVTLKQTFDILIKSGRLNPAARKEYDEYLAKNRFDTAAFGVLH